MNEVVLKIKEFSITPGTRHIDEGPFSGEEFRINVLTDKYREAKNNNKKLLIDLDGTIGYGTSWLEEAFGGLAREWDKEDILSRISFISNEEPYLIEDIIGYIKNA
ncbi:STAS-like domain-containing protein [Leptospira terpstrae]|uniref:PF14213 domain protein n=1 Tax=Leptospira terpstrae serovar Hualin str. LT 11-33 = ATCC 700639 TaxID=1257025 RepID=N1VZ01_9LEPT|nr:STAS-like domain-containing protein [Leptospira terpstrae]EMY60651.1 PF14213 domain protein [Leptospira terpstrae serovar Hualin str. LT 11-33 = ATCC 700639]